MAIITSIKEVNQLIITCAASIVLLVGGLTWICLSADRGIKDVNQKTTAQIIEEQYQSCLTYSSKSQDCRRAQ